MNAWKFSHHHSIARLSKKIIVCFIKKWIIKRVKFNGNYIVIIFKRCIGSIKCLTYSNKSLCFNSITVLTVNNRIISIFIRQNFVAVSAAWAVLFKCNFCIFRCNVKFNLIFGIFKIYRYIKWLCTLCDSKYTRCRLTAALISCIVFIFAGGKLKLWGFIAVFVLYRRICLTAVCWCYF